MEFNFQSLCIDSGQFKSSTLSSRRLARIEEAIKWPRGPSIAEKIYYPVWPQDNSTTGFSIQFGKPGKETQTNRVNINDMTPTIFNDDEIFPARGSFTDIFSAIEDLVETDKEATSILGGLLFRSAFMLDHIQTKEGVWRYKAPMDAIEFLRQKNINIYELPPDVFLAYMDAIGWNEDVKYRTHGYDVTGKQKNNGRLNNMLTYVNICDVLMHSRRVSDIFAGFANGRGVSAISLKKAGESFSYLKVPKRLG